MFSSISTCSPQRVEQVRPVRILELLVRDGAAHHRDPDADRIEARDVVAAVSRAGCFVIVCSRLSYWTARSPTSSVAARATTIRSQGRHTVRAR